MAIQNPPIFLQEGSHPAEDVRRALGSLTGYNTGLVSGDALVVSENAAGADMSVDISEGAIWLAGTEASYQGSYYCENRGVQNVPIQPADVVDPRIDLVVARVFDSAYSGTQDEWELDILTGTPAASPVAPTLPANSFSLATINVAANATTIVNADITDTRTLTDETITGNLIVDGDLTVDTNTLFVDSTNNYVGVGTASPTTRFEVSGAALFDNVYSESSHNWNFGQLQLTREASNTANTKIVSLMLDGDTNSSTDLYSNVNFILRTDSAPTTGSTSTGLNAGLEITAPDSVRFGTDSAERMRIDSSGNVGIGKTPTAILDVAGTTAIKAIGSYTFTTPNGVNLNVANNGIISRSSSSAKYKTDVETLDDEHADIVFNLRPVWFRSTTDVAPEHYSYYGFIAEEVAEVDPRLVDFGPMDDCDCPQDEEGTVEHCDECFAQPEGVYYDRLIPHLTSVVQRQQAQIDALSARLDALEGGN